MLLLLFVSPYFRRFVVLTLGSTIPLSDPNMSIVQKSSQPFHFAQFLTLARYLASDMTQMHTLSHKQTGQQPSHIPCPCHPLAWSKLLNSGKASIIHLGDSHSHPPYYGGVSRPTKVADDTAITYFQQTVRLLVHGIEIDLSGTVVRYVGDGVFAHAKLPGKPTI